MRAGEVVMFVTEPDVTVWFGTETIVGANAVKNNAAAFNLMCWAGGAGVSSAEELVTYPTTLLSNGDA